MTAHRACANDFVICAACDHDAVFVIASLRGIRQNPSKSPHTAGRARGTVVDPSGGMDQQTLLVGAGGLAVALLMAGFFRIVRTEADLGEVSQAWLADRQRARLDRP